MFEKEAEEIVNKSLCSKIRCYGHCSFSSPKHHRCGDWHRCYEIAKKGAEFGYNKTKEEIDYLNKHWENGKNKANEWHKAADGDIPENERWVCNQDGCYCYYDIDTEQWLDVEGTRTKTIEWCDMPTKESE